MSVQISSPRNFSYEYQDFWSLLWYQLLQDVHLLNLTSNFNPSLMRMIFQTVRLCLCMLILYNFNNSFLSQATPSPF